MARDWNELAANIVELVGGKDNVTSVAHCVTRLRFKLKDESKADDKKISDLDGVIQVMHASGQYQVVIGKDVADAYDAVLPLLPGLEGGEVAADDAEPAEEEEKKGFSLDSLFDVVSGIFVPFIGIFIAAGLTRAFATMAVTFGLLAETDSTYVILNAIGDGVFQFLPIFIARNAAKKFNCNEWVAMAVAAFLCAPNMVALKDTFAEAGGPTLFGIPVIMPDAGYLQSVFPIIFAIYLQSWIEKPVAKLPRMVRDLFGKLIVLVCTSIITLLVVGPVINTVANALAQGMVAILNVVPAVAGFLLGALWPVIIIFGMHWGVIPIQISNMMTLGYDSIAPITNGTNYIIGAACLAILLKSKKQKIRNTATECMASAWLGGITEPAIYGLLLKYKRSFAMMCLACGVSGCIAALMNCQQTAIFTSSVFTIPVLAANVGVWQIAACAIGTVVGFVLVFLFGYNDNMDADE